MTYADGLACALCGRPADGAEATSCGVCGGPTLVHYSAIPRDIEASPGETGLWRYSAWLPRTDGVQPVSLGEGATPLVRLGRWAEQIGLAEVYAKLEYAGPTGSFKDRGSSVLLTHAMVVGATQLVEDSSGNAGASIAAYAARAGLACTIYAPAAAPAGKLRQIAAYGAQLVPIEGTRENVAEAAMAAAREPGTYYAGHNTNPYFVEGTKTLAFELVEAFGMRAPAHVVMPVGGGSLLWGCALGFSQWQQADICDHVPKLHAIQSTGCMPLAAAYAQGADEPSPVSRHPTVAGGITIEHPARGRLILRSLRESGGSALAVADDEILQAQQRLASLEGIFVEPTAAAAFAGLARLAARGVVKPNESVVVAVTGSGLKDPDALDLWP
ncbi:MAG: threonine synthase [Dehalococcoidia bacterium]